MSRDQRTDERVSARGYVEHHERGGVKTYLKVGGGTPFFYIDKVGVRKIDILPYRAGKGNPYRDEGRLAIERPFFSHRGIGVNQEAFICLAKTFKMKCPICEYRAKMAQNASTTKELLQSLKPKERQLFNVIDLEDDERLVRIWDISYYLFGERLKEEIKNADEEEGYEFFADLKEGMSLKLGVTEGSFGGGGKFMKVTTIGFKRRRDPYSPDILDKVYCLDDLLIAPSYEEVSKAFFEVEEKRDEDHGSDDDGWSTPSAQPARTAGKVRDAKSEKDDNDDWDAPPPKRREEQKQLVKEEPKQENPNGLTCPACQGTGKSSRGNPCRPCEGTGTLRTDDDEPAPRQEQTKERKLSQDDDWDQPAPALRSGNGSKEKASAKVGDKKAEDWDNW